MANGTIPLHAVLAATEAGTEVFVDSQKRATGTVLCIGYIDLETAEACSPRAKAEREGVAIMNIVDGSATMVAVLLPRGTPSVLFRNRNGATENVTVTKRVAFLQGVAIASFSYALPDGGVHTTTVRWPRQTGRSVLTHHPNRWG